jgi:hypothetical protein
MDRLIGLCTMYLSLHAKVEVKLRTSFPYKMRNTRAYHTGWLKGDKPIKHVINILVSEEDARNTDTVIAHEFVHAWQTEYYINSKTHGKRFAKMCFELREFLNNNGYNIATDIYCEKTDK